MRLLTREGKRSPDIRDRATSLTASLPSKARFQEIRACFDFVRDNMRYVSDITETETLPISASAVLEYMQGDCDDFCVLLASLLESIGHRTMFTAVAFKYGIEGWQYSHVIVQVHFHGDRVAGIPPGWIPLDTTVTCPMGWKPPNVQHEMIIHNG